MEFAVLRDIAVCCRYDLEAEHQQRFRELLADDPIFYVPKVSTSEPRSS